eukprot:TRINITY_DN27165_c0_g1_i1.p1 TRINITY_DN27165_c0_g1~~TRINITY_DN27165_c0_g1_i1.p1  ORF type:complete len:809 (-),score=143.55 TRINITY_DN27165_c0_g1_i1:516-2942(-)
MRRVHQRLLALAALACCLRQTAASISTPDFSDFSPQCQSDLLRYLLCPLQTNVYGLCTSERLMNNSLIQTILNCNAGDPHSSAAACKQRCLNVVKEIANDTVNEPCPTYYQAMRFFSADLDLLALALPDMVADQLPAATYFPFPNVKTMSGITSMDIGEPEKCAEIDIADYCVMQGSVPSASPAPHSMGPLMNMAAGAAAPAMSFYFGLCLPNRCPQSAYAQVMAGLQGASNKSMKLDIECQFVKPVANVTQGGSKMSSFLGWGFVPIEYLNKYEVKPGTVVMVAIFSVLVVLAVAGTGTQLRLEAKAEGQRGSSRVVVMEGGASSEPLHTGAQGQEQATSPSAFTSMLLHWSLLRNGRSFVKTRQPESNTFACLDFIRVLSMCQVILGHSFVYGLSSAGFSNIEQFLPPNGLISSLPFALVPGCFYGVDSFFLMSGFLCAHSLDRKIFSKPSATAPKNFSVMYAKFLFFRYLRLVPLLMFCIGITNYILPFLGKGVLWNITKPGNQHCSDMAGGSDCQHYWWTNLLFIQNVDQFLMKCMPHTWYLAADFQIYLTAPFFSLAYALDRRLGWSVLALGLVVGIVLPMLLMAQYQFVPDMLFGGTDYSRQIYMKPWSRMSPFVIGIGTAWLWNEKFSKHSGSHETTRGRAVKSVVLSVIAVALLALATFLRTVFYQCDAISCMSLEKNPAGKVFSYIWVGFSIPCWSLGMAMLMTLCFQNRFLPVLQDAMHAAFWQPIAKLTYAAYLIHTSVLILDFCQRSGMMVFTGASYLFGVTAYVVFTMALAFVLWLMFEKPIANMQMALLGGAGD